MTTHPLGAVLVHGLWHGRWAWDQVRHRLDLAGIATAAVELPLTELACDVAATNRVLDQFDRPAILVGHSYGGAVITAAGAHPTVTHLVYLAAFQLADGESVGRTLPALDIPPTRLGDALHFSQDSDQVTLDPALAREILYSDADSETAAAAVALLRPVTRNVFGGVPEVQGLEPVRLRPAVEGVRLAAPAGAGIPAGIFMRAALRRSLSTSKPNRLRCAYFLIVGVTFLSSL